MNVMHPSAGTYDFGLADAIVAYGEDNGINVHGHSLILNNSTPDWVKNFAGTDQEFEDMIEDYITTVVTRYKGKVTSWDVVNEAIDDGSGNPLRNLIFKQKKGSDYIKKCFQFARDADPNAVLFYNDFNIERDTVKLNAVLNMVNEFKAKGVPISGIGFQMHIRMDIPDEMIAYSLKKAAETGLQIHLSEVDIIFNTHNDERLGGIQNYSVLTDEMKQAQAEKYKSLIKMYKEIVPKEQQFGITFWDFTDRDSWIKGFFNMKDWPCIYDDSLQAKPAYFGVLDELL